MTTILATYYAKIQDVPDSEYKVEILEDGPVKKVAVNGKVYDVDYNVGGDSIYSIIINHHSHGVHKIKNEDALRLCVRRLAESVKQPLLYHNQQ